MNRFTIISLALVSMLLSCTRPVQSGRDTIGLVKSIASDAASAENKLLSSFKAVPPSGSICIAGSPGRCASLCASFAACDLFENARGRSWSDDLKDFAGESFYGISDEVFAPYWDYVRAEGEEALREAAVRMALAALDSKCSVSIYDLDGNRPKSPAKVIVLADPWLLQCGKFDIDTLFTLTSCKVPVLSPQEQMFDAVFGGPRKGFHLGILCDSVSLRQGVYERIYEAKTKQHGMVGTSLFTGAAAGEENVLKQFLDAYAAAGNTEALDVLMVDDLQADITALEAELAAIRDYSREESMRYGKLVSPDFHILSSSRAVMEYCYQVLRSKDLFTHKIAQPQCEFFSVKPGVAGGAPFLLIPSNNV